MVFVDKCWPPHPIKPPQTGQTLGLLTISPPFLHPHRFSSGDMVLTPTTQLVFDSPGTTGREKVAATVSSSHSFHTE